MANSILLLMAVFPRVATLICQPGEWEIDEKKL